MYKYYEQPGWFKQSVVYVRMSYIYIFVIQRPGSDSYVGKSGMGIRQEAYQARINSMSAETSSLDNANKLAASDLKNMLRKGSPVTSSPQQPPPSSFPENRKRAPNPQHDTSDSEEEPEDNVKWAALLSL